MVKVWVPQCFLRLLRSRWLACDATHPAASDAEELSCWQLAKSACQLSLGSVRSFLSVQAVQAASLQQLLGHVVQPASLSLHSVKAVLLFNRTVG